MAELDGKMSFTGRYPVPESLSSRINCYRFDHGQDGRLTGVTYRKRGRISTDDRLGAAKILFEYSGDSEKRYYLNEKGNHYRDGRINIRVLSRDEREFPASLIAYDRDMHPIADQSGVSRCLYEPDSAGFIFRATFADTQGSRIDNENGVSEVRQKYDRTGNVIEQAYYDDDGDLRGFERYLFDELGNIIEMSEYDDKGNPADHAFYGIHKARYRIDELGNRIEERYYDDEGNPAERSDGGFAILRRRFNFAGDLLEESYFSRDDKKKGRVASVCYSFDSAGNEIEQTFLGEDGDTIAVNRLTYNEDGFLTEIRYYGRHGQPVETAEEGAAMIRWKYGDEGNVIEIELYDKDGDLKEVKRADTEPRDQSGNDDGRPKDSSWVFGVVFGDPSGLALLAGHSFSTIKVRLSGGYWGKTIYGVQADLVKSLSWSRSFNQNVGVVGGISASLPEGKSWRKWNYAGIAYDLNWSGLFFQFGVNIGHGSWENPFFNFQLGYVR